MNWMTQAATAIVKHEAPAAAPTSDAMLAEALNALGLQGLIQPRDLDFARSLYAGFQRYGSFTERQRPYVERIIATAGGPAPVTPPAPVVKPDTYPNVCATVNLDRFARFQIGDLSLHLKNDGSVIWVKWAGVIVGLIEHGSQVFKATRRYTGDYQINLATEALKQVEIDPMAAAKRDGVLTGRCSCCSRPLTDPASIEIGIGPICLSKFGGAA